MQGLPLRRAPISPCRSPGWAGRRGNIAGPSGAGRVHPAPHRPRPDLRRPGGDRDRERPAVRRGAGADARLRGGAAAADRDRRRAEGHQPLGVRPQPVLHTLVESAASLCGADNGDVILLATARFSTVAAATGRRIRSANSSQISPHPHRPSGPSAAACVLDGRGRSYPRCRADPEYTLAQTPASAGYRSGSGRAADSRRRGRSASSRWCGREPRAFTARQIELVQTFADQAVIAIENVRLFDEVQARTRDLEEALAAADGDRGCPEGDQPLRSDVRRCSRQSSTVRQRSAAALESAAVYPASTGTSVRGVAQRGWTGRRLGPATRRRSPAARSGIAVATSAAPRSHSRSCRQARLPEDKMKRREGSRRNHACFGVPMLREGRGDRRPSSSARTPCEALLGAADRARPDLRRPGRDRDRERAPVRRGAGAHPRSRRRCAADRDRRRAEGHQPLGVRSGRGARHACLVRGRSLCRRRRRRRSASVTATGSDIGRQLGAVTRRCVEYHRASILQRPVRASVAGRVLLAGRSRRSSPTCWPIRTTTSGDGRTARDYRALARRAADARRQGRRRVHAGPRRSPDRSRRARSSSFRPSPTRR